jgi:hypothetical protein
MPPTSRCAECGTGLPPSGGEPLIVCATCGRVAFLERGGRGPTTPLPFVDPSCRDLTGGTTTAVASDDDGEHGPAEAIDGHRGSMWSAGKKAPAWWCVDLGEIQPIRGVTLVPAMQPAIGRVLHVVETCAAGEDWTVHVTLDQTMTDAGVYSYDFGTPVQARWLRIRTEASVSNVGWYEIGIFG